MPLPRSLPQLKREISEKKWAEARRREGDRVSQKNYKLPAKQKTYGMAAGSSTKHATRFYQLKTGYRLTVEYINCNRNRSSAQRWWCRYRIQTQEHDFKGPGVARQAENDVGGGQEETGRWCQNTERPEMTDRRRLARR
jgi:hypothetical protein